METSRLNEIKRQLFVVIFGTDTRAGRNFDLALLWLILISTAIVLLESVSEVNIAFGQTLLYVEYGFTAIFTIEYLVRVWIARKPLGYIISFYGIIDLLSIMPTYLELMFPETHLLIIIRVFRLMRIFRIMKLSRFMHESDALWNSLKASRAKISVFLFAVVNVALISGTIMYLVEGGENGFTSIPRSIYWAVVTMTTVGFGDIHPHTALGQFLSMVLMITGYGIIAVPTGIIGVELVRGDTKPSDQTLVLTNKHCNNCGKTGHLEGSNYCMQCGAEL